jgi:hypothetical protein
MDFEQQWLLETAYFGGSNKTMSDMANKKSILPVYTNCSMRLISRNMLNATSSRDQIVEGNGTKVGVG